MHLDMKNLKKKKLIESQKGSIDKFIISNKQNIIQNLDEIQKKMVFNFAIQQILIMNFKIIQKKMKTMMKNII